MTEPNESNRSVPKQLGPVARFFEWVFGRYFAVAALPAGVVMLYVAVTNVDTVSLEPVWPFIVGVIGFILCLISVGGAVEWVGERISGKYRKRQATGTEPPESSLHDFVIGILMLVAGMAVILAAVFLSGEFIGETVAIFVGLMGFFMVGFSFQLFGSAIFGPFFRWIWSFSWVQFAATGVMLMVLVYVLYDAAQVIMNRM